MAQTTLRWALIGAGTAGRARARAILADPASELVAVFRGRYAAEIGAPVVASLPAALAAADAVCIASPSPVHAEQARLALEAGCHVVVDFPLAQSESEARALFELARRRKRVLHVEHIELLTPTSRVLAGRVRQPLVKRASVHFQGPGPEDEPGADLVYGNVARLHRLIAACGPVKAVDSVRAEPGRLQARLTLHNGAPAEVLFEQSSYFARRTTLEIEDDEAVWKQENEALMRGRSPQTLLGGDPLFAQDHSWARRRMLGQIADSYVSEERILHVLAVADALREGLVPRFIAPG